MTLEQLKKSTDDMNPPPGLSRPLLALWHDARSDWEAAHGVAQDIHDATGAWIHAYLHRKEGDDANAAYWYSRAGRPIASGTLDEEWEHIVATLLERG